jgi:hypothetical protein
MKWYELVAAGILGAIVFCLVAAGLEQQPPAPRGAAAAANVTLVGPPTIHAKPAEHARDQH